MKTDKSIEEIAQEHLPYMKILEQAGSFAVFLSDRFGLGLRDRINAVIWAYENGLVSRSN